MRIFFLQLNNPSGRLARVALLAAVFAGGLLLGRSIARWRVEHVLTAALNPSSQQSDVALSTPTLSQWVAVLQGLVAKPLVVDWRGFEAAGYPSDGPLPLRIHLSHPNVEEFLATADGLVDAHVDNGALVVEPKLAADREYLRTYAVGDICKGYRIWDGVEPTAEATTVAQKPASSGGEALGRILNEAGLAHATFSSTGLRNYLIIGGRLIVWDAAEQHRTVHDVLGRLRAQIRRRDGAVRRSSFWAMDESAGAAVPAIDLAHLSLGATIDRLREASGATIVIDQDLRDRASWQTPESRNALPDGLLPAGSLRQCLQTLGEMHPEIGVVYSDDGLILVSRYRAAFYPGKQCSRFFPFHGLAADDPAIEWLEDHASHARWPGWLFATAFPEDMATVSKLLRDKR